MSENSSDLAQEITDLEKSTTEQKKALADAQARLEELKSKQVELRSMSLQNLASDLLDHIRESVQITNVTERDDLKSGPLDDDLLPSVHSTGALCFFSAYERKGYVTTSNKVDFRNHSYQNNETIVVQILVPRRDVADILTRHGFTA